MVLSKESSRSKIDKWVDKLSKESLPLFAHTARKIASISANNDASISEMSHSILSDSSMTARVLKMANSVQYNPTMQPINTVSRAIVVLGFDCVKNIALSISLIDTILSGIRHERAIEEMIRAYHAAIQAKHLAAMQGVENQEEIFIAALLHRIGHLTFWCFSYGQAETLDFEYSMTKDRDTAERNVLGFSLSELTEELANKWHLSDLLEESLAIESQQASGQKGVKGNKAASNGAEAVLRKPSRNSMVVSYGYKIAASSEHGWSSPQSTEALQDLSTHLKRQTQDLKQLAFRAAEESVQALQTLGIPNPEKLIPRNGLGSQSAIDSNPGGKAHQAIENAISIQLPMLREISSMVFQGAEINIVLNMVLEGVFRGLLMDRTIFAILDPKSKTLKAKFVLGAHREIILERFNFSVQDQQENMVTNLLKSGQPTFLNQHLRYKQSHLMTDEIKRSIGDNDAFLMPIYIGKVPKGIIYADRCNTREPMSDEQFQVFVHFCEHVNIAFKMLNGQGKS